MSLTAFISFSVVRGNGEVHFYILISEIFENYQKCIKGTISSRSIGHGIGVLVLE